MKRVIEDLLGRLRNEPLHPLALTAYCQNDPARMLERLPGALTACGGWILRQVPFATDAAGAVFEIERSASMEMYAALARLGLVFDRSSELALAQTCQCTHYVQDGARFDVVTVELLIEQREADTLLPTAA